MNKKLNKETPLQIDRIFKEGLIREHIFLDYNKFKKFEGTAKRCNDVLMEDKERIMNEQIHSHMFKNLSIKVKVFILIYLKEWALQDSQGNCYVATQVEEKFYLK